MSTVQSIGRKELRERLPRTAFAFRGYNVTNLGRTAELLAHAVYGPIVEECLRTAGEIASDELHRSIDLLDRVRAQEETNLAAFADAVALIVAMECAQVRLLRELFDVDLLLASRTLGYSLGEIAALVCDGSIRLEDALPVPISMADDCAALGENVRMGILFSRGAVLDQPAIDTACRELNLRGEGIIGVSAHLSPNTRLLLGEGNLVEEFRDHLSEMFPGSVHLRIDDRRWPPLHTPVVWERCVPNRAARRMLVMPTQIKENGPKLISMVTGAADYTEETIRPLLTKWVDHPQRVWDVVYETLRVGIETIVHVGPAPNLLPSTYKRLSDNVEVQLSRSAPRRFGGRFVSTISRRAWLANLLPKRSALLRAPYVRHIILEDWLLEQQP